MSKSRSLFAAAPADIGLLLLRLFFGLTLAAEHGWFKIRDLAKFTHGIAAAGFPLPWLLAPASAATEFFGGLLIAIGLFARPAAAFVLTNMLVAAFRMHAGQPFHEKELALAYAAAALTISIAGPGRLRFGPR
jgi:putative oxidoreductase